MLLHSVLLTVAFAFACLLIFPAVVLPARTDHTDDTREQTMPGPPNFCLEGIYHKDTPSAEEEDFTECFSWQDLACCTVNLAEMIRDSETRVLYNYTPDCGTLSPECEEYLKVL